MKKVKTRCLHSEYWIDQNGCAHCLDCYQIGIKLNTEQQEIFPGKIVSFVWANQKTKKGKNKNESTRRSDG